MYFLKRLRNREMKLRDYGWGKEITAGTVPAAMLGWGRITANDSKLSLFGNIAGHGPKRNKSKAKNNRACGRGGGSR